MSLPVGFLITSTAFKMHPFILKVWSVITAYIKQFTGCYLNKKSLDKDIVSKKICVWKIKNKIFMEIFG